MSAPAQPQQPSKARRPTTSSPPPFAPFSHKTAPPATTRRIRRNRINFLKANTIQDIESNRGLWRNVAAQLRNRTMPPVETKLSEDDRLRVATWIDNRLRQTACAVGRLRRRGRACAA